MSFLQTNRFIIISYTAQPFSPLMTGRRLRQTEVLYVYEGNHTKWFVFFLTFSYPMKRICTHCTTLSIFSYYIMLVDYYDRVVEMFVKLSYQRFNGLDFASVAQISWLNNLSK